MPTRLVHTARTYSGTDVEEEDTDENEDEVVITGTGCRIFAP